jgi:hypothetical protein
MSKMRISAGKKAMVEIEESNMMAAIRTPTEM